MRKVDAMANPTITIPLDQQTARAYDSAAPEQKRKIQALLSLWLRDLATGDYLSLQQVLDEVRRKAKARGLTPEMLDSLLKGA
jgi:predicted amino acid racemase